jgi:hypothetical protein
VYRASLRSVISDQMRTICRRPKLRAYLPTWLCGNRARPQTSICAMSSLSDDHRHAPGPGDVRTRVQRCGARRSLCICPVAIGRAPRNRRLHLGHTIAPRPALQRGSSVRAADSLGGRTVHGSPRALDSLRWGARGEWSWPPCSSQANPAASRCSLCLRAGTLTHPLRHRPRFETATCHSCHRSKRRCRGDRLRCRVTNYRRGAGHYRRGGSGDRPGEPQKPPKNWSPVNLGAGDGAWFTTSRE